MVQLRVVTHFIFKITSIAADLIFNQRPTPKKKYMIINLQKTKLMLKIMFINVTN
jgi:hypothetical protein